MRGKTCLKRNKSTLVNSFPGVEERTIGRKSLGLEGRLVFGIRATWDLSHRSGTDVVWFKTELKKETNSSCKPDCIIENINS